MECEPFETAPALSFASRSAWIAEAPGIVARMLDRWQLVPGEAFIGGIAASVLAVTTADGLPAVLKVGYPHPEAMWEAVGLASFPAGTAPRVLRQDAWTWSLLLEAVHPGTPLSLGEVSPTEALRIGGALHARLATASAPPRIPSLAEAMREYSTNATARLPSQRLPLDRLGVRELVVHAIEQLEYLAESSDERCLLHGDFNPGNILRGPNDAWLAIDPKPLIGEAAYDLWPLVSQVGKPFDSADPATRLREQLACAADAAKVDASRAAQWAFARTGLNVSWYLAEDNWAQAEVEARALNAWARVSMP